MTTIDSHVGVATKSAGSGSTFLAASAEWVTSADHKRVGRLFLCTALLFSVASAVVGALIGLERMSPSELQIVHGDSVIQLLSIYRFGLILATLAPLFVGIAVAVVPMQVGSRAIALPRLSQLGFWLWFFGVVTVAVSIIGNGGPGGGATDLVDLYLLGVALTMSGLMAASLSVVVTVLTSRAPGMALDMVPPFTWSALVGCMSILLTLPVAIGTIAYLYIDRTYGQQVFGGNKGIDSYLSWVMTQPQNFVFAIMALGVLAELAPIVGGRRHPRRSLVVIGTGLVSMAVLGAVTQSSHVLVWTGSFGDKVKSGLPFLFFNGLPLLGVLVLIGSAVLAFKEGKPRASSSMVFVAAGSLLVLAGFAGHFFSSIESSELIGTSFEEGVTLYLVLGGLLSGLGAVSHWSPKLWGRILDDQRFVGFAAIGLFGAVLAALPLYVAGLSGQPLGSVYDFDYSGPIGLWNGLNVLGLFMIVLSVVPFVLQLAWVTAFGATAPDDPWDGQTLEWAIPSPAPTNNFAELAVVSSPEPLLDAKPTSNEVSS